MIYLIAMFSVFAIVAFSAMWSGFVLTLLWQWFIVPTFGLPAMSLSVAIGVSLTVGYLTHQYIEKPAEQMRHADRFGHALSYTAMRPAIALLIGWIVKQWI